jgi:cytochrome c-type biogenesis protein CcmH/NrfG
VTVPNALLVLIVALVLVGNYAQARAQTIERKRREAHDARVDARLDKVIQDLEAKVRRLGE